MHQIPQIDEPRRAKSFDVICAGEALGAIASALTSAGLRVGLATVLPDDEPGRRSRERIASSGVDIDGVALARPRSGFVLTGLGGARQTPRDAEEQPPVQVPAGWSSQLLLLSGLSPVVSHAAALCKAARRARRDGALVLIDFNASLHLWTGRDPRTIQMVLREVDVARCSLVDLAVLGADLAMVRASLRSHAVLVVCNEAGGAVAIGPFGEVSVGPTDASPALRESATGDAFTAALCRELTRGGEPGESSSALWHRALKRALTSPRRAPL